MNQLEVVAVCRMKCLNRIGTKQQGRCEAVTALNPRVKVMRYYFL